MTKLIPRVLKLCRTAAGSSGFFVNLRDSWGLCRRRAGKEAKQQAGRTAAASAEAPSCLAVNRLAAASQSELQRRLWRLFQYLDTGRFSLNFFAAEVGFI